MKRSGIFSVYKPVGMTSHDVVNRIRKATGVKRVGHGGTLDPLAEGVLIIAVGRENTKQLDLYVKGEKEYVATIKLGSTSETDDREGPIHTYETDNKRIPTEGEIKKCVKKFIGEIKQTPPLYSAIKVNGKEAYKRVRHGEDFKMKKRNVEIKEIEILSYKYPLLEIRIVCGSGTYIRSLARDIGEKLKTGAYLEKLVRTRVGKFITQEAILLQNIDRLA